MVRTKTSASPISIAEPKRSRGCWAISPTSGWAWGLALGTIVAWQIVVAARLPHTLGDEMYHVPAIQALARGEPLPRELPMFPTYHWLAALPARLFGTELWVLRVFQGVVGVAALLLYQAVIRMRYPDAGGDRLLHLAWNPLVFPFFVLVYTDVAALTAVLAGVYFQLRGRHLLAAGALLLACLLRQSNLVWVVFLAVWRITDLWSAENTGLGVLRHFGALVRRERLWLHGLVLAIGAGVLVWCGGFVRAPFMENRPAFNVAQFYLFGLAMLVCWLPHWGTTLVREWRSVFGPALLRPWWCAMLIAAAGLLVVAFRNDHPWNQELEFLHNWPLRAMAASLPVRIAVAVGIVAFVAIQGRATRHSPARRALLLTWGFALLFLVPHFPADARYYIVPLVLLDLLTPYSPTETRRLAGWYFLLTLGVGTFIAARAGPYGGL